MRNAVFIGPRDLIDKDLLDQVHSLQFQVELYKTPEAFLFDGHFLENCIYFIYSCPGHITENNLIRLLRLKDKISLIYAVSIDVSESDLEQSLYAGADFSIKLPVHVKRCVVEIKNHFQKIDHLTESKRKGGVELISEGCTIRRNGKALKLTGIEFKIFNCLFENLDKTLTREEIISQIHLNDSTTRTVDAHVCSLRRKIDLIKISIDTVRGRGYQLSVMS